MLFKSIEEIKPYLSGINLTFQFDDISSYIEEAERDYIIPWLSQEQFDVLQTAYDTNSQETVHQDLLKKVQTALANYSYLLYLPIGLVKFGVNGIYISQSQTDRIPYEWTIDKITNRLTTSGDNAIEDMLRFLETNAGVYEAWKNSSEYTDYKDSILNTAHLFSEFIEIGSSRRLFLKLRAIIQTKESNELIAATGQAMYDEVFTQFKGRVLNPDNTVLIKYMRRSLAPLVMERAWISLALKVDDKGISLVTTSLHNSKDIDLPADANKIAFQRNLFAQDATRELKKLKDFLNANASLSKYNAYFTSSSYNAPGSTGSAYTNGSDKPLFVP